MLLLFYPQCRTGTSTEAILPMFECKDTKKFGNKYPFERKTENKWCFIGKITKNTYKVCSSIIGL